MLATQPLSESIIETARKYQRHAYMYIEYPHKSYWSEKFSVRDLSTALQQFKVDPEPLMLYVHFPYCTRQCFYCTCHTEISPQREQWRDYLRVLFKEIDLYQKLLQQQQIDLNVVEVHLGGGSPTLLAEDEFDALVGRLDAFVGIRHLREFAIEVDPRHTNHDKLRYYHDHGINRISLGIQDFDPEVQKAINRIQPVDMVRSLMSREMRALFSHGINFDILCGLPLQTPDSIRRTFETVVELAPDRICLNHLHFAPEFAPHQRIMVDGKNGRPTCLPDAAEKRALFDTALEILTQNGYVRTGFDHFALPDDDVAQALQDHRMKWNSLGVTAGAYNHVLGLGPHSTSTLFNTYAQNVYGTAPYAERVQAGEFPLYRGVVLNRDDEIRREVIQTLRNFSRLQFSDLERHHSLIFSHYFAAELQAMQPLARDGLVILSDHGIQVTELGQEFVLHVCACFDAYLTPKACRR